MVIGDKPKAQLTHAAPKNLAMTFNQIGRGILTLVMLDVADWIVKSGTEYDSIVIVYSRFVDSLSYGPVTVEVGTSKGGRSSPPCSGL
jgi:F-type H+-transporting ATPase subunit gamma